MESNYLHCSSFCDKWAVSLYLAQVAELDPSKIDMKCAVRTATDSPGLYYEFFLSDLPLVFGSCSLFNPPKTNLYDFTVCPNIVSLSSHSYLVSIWEVILSVSSNLNMYRKWKLDVVQSWPSDHPSPLGSTLLSDMPLANKTSLFRNRSWIIPELYSYAAAVSSTVMTHTEKGYVPGISMSLHIQYKKKIFSFSVFLHVWLYYATDLLKIG